MTHTMIVVCKVGWLHSSGNKRSWLPHWLARGNMCLSSQESSHNPIHKQFFEVHSFLAYLSTSWLMLLPHLPITHSHAAPAHLATPHPAEEAAAYPAAEAAAPALPTPPKVNPTLASKHSCLGTSLGAPCPHLLHPLPAVSPDQAALVDCESLGAELHEKVLPLPTRSLQRWRVKWERGMPQLRPHLQVKWDTG